MIELNTAARSAKEYFRSLYRSTLINVRIEEVELSEDEKYWFITLGYDIPGTSKTPKFQEALGAPSKLDREYKIFKIEAGTGRVISMKIRKI